MSKKILFYSDFHLNYKLFNEITAIGTPKRADEIYSTFNWLNSLVTKYNISHVINGGDTFNSVNDLKLPFVKIAMDGLNLIKTTQHILDGNHDKSDKNFFVTSLFKYIVNEIIHEPTSVFMPDLGVRFTYFPFFRDLNEANTIITTLLKKHKEPTIVFMHQGIEGKVIDDLAISPKLFDAPHIKKVFAGHYHFAFEEGKIIYPGSCFSVNFIDDQPRKVVIYDIENDKLIYEENPICSYFISLPQKSINENIEKLSEMASKCYLRVELTSSKEELTIPYEFLEKFKGYSIIVDVPQKEFMPQYTYVDNEFTAEAASSDIATGELDFNYDAFKQLVLNTAENKKYQLEHNVKPEILEEVLKTSFELGI
jgi:DNA repair exonuclease SbcCD nuclease subunit